MLIQQIIPLIGLVLMYGGKNDKDSDSMQNSLQAIKDTDTFKELEELPGVGHKTASVVMSQGFGHAAFPIDTHIHRLAHRWGLSNGQNVQKTERDLKQIFPENTWNRLHLQIIYWGRENCQARACFGLECYICKSCYPRRKTPIQHKRG